MLRPLQNKEIPGQQLSFVIKHIARNTKTLLITPEEQYEPMWIGRVDIEYDKVECSERVWSLL